MGIPPSSDRPLTSVLELSQIRKRFGSAVALDGADFALARGEVHGLLGGFTGVGAKTVIPARAMAKVSCRLVPDQRPEKMVPLIERAVSEAAPPGTRLLARRTRG